MTTPTVTELVRNGRTRSSRPAHQRRGPRHRPPGRWPRPPYLVERELEQDGNTALQALVADYVKQAQRYGEIPMHVPLGRYLAHIED